MAKLESLLRSAEDKITETRQRYRETRSWFLQLQKEKLADQKAARQRFSELEEELLTIGTQLTMEEENEKDARRRFSESAARDIEFTRQLWDWEDFLNNSPTTASSSSVILDDQMPMMTGALDPADYETTMVLRKTLSAADDQITMMSEQVPVGPSGRPKRKISSIDSTEDTTTKDLPRSVRRSKRRSIKRFDLQPLVFSDDEEL